MDITLEKSINSSLIVERVAEALSPREIICEYSFGSLKISPKDIENPFTSDEEAKIKVVMFKNGIGRFERASDFHNADGVATSFATTNEMVMHDYLVLKNGVIQREGADNDYTVKATRMGIDCVAVPYEGSLIEIKYWKWL